MGCSPHNGRLCSAGTAQFLEVCGQSLKQKMKQHELAEVVGITVTNLPILKTGKAKAIRLPTPGAICRQLKCQPGDVLEFRADDTGGAAGDG